MKKTLTPLFIAAAALFGCTQNNDLDSIDPNMSSPTFTATTETSTRTEVDSFGNVLWSADDKITVFAANTAGSEYTIKAAFVGQKSGDFTGEAATYGEALDCNIAYYPHSIENIYSSVEGAHTLNVVLPTMQTYAESSFGKGANAMVAVTPDVATTALAFKNVCGAVKLQLLGTTKISKIEF